MKIDLGVVSTTVTDYDDVITNIGDIRSRIKNTESDLSNRGWSGEAQKNIVSL